MSDNPSEHILQHIIESHPELAHDASLPDRLERAYAHAVVLGHPVPVKAQLLGQHREIGRVAQRLSRCRALDDR